MTQYLYMNHRIKQAKPRGPVIVLQRENPVQKIESNCFVLMVGGRAIGRVVFEAGGLSACDTHEVKAWVELDDEVAVFGKVEIITEKWLVTPGEPAQKLRRVPASAKVSNKPVNFNIRPGQPLVKK